MTDKERLEEIKSRVWKDKGIYAMGDYSQREGYIYTLSDYDYEWLVKQAECVEKLETQLSINTNNMKHLQNKIERYKQALEFYADERNHEREWDTFTDSGVEKSKVMKDGGEKARKALKGETK